MDVLNFPRLVIEQVSPLVDGGRFPIKRVEGEPVQATAAIYKDGHDLILADLCIVPDGDRLAVMTSRCPCTSKGSAIKASN